MKLIRQTARILLALLLLIALTVVVVLSVDSFRTGYLRTNRVWKTETQRLLIRNVHVVPMTSDTVLKNKMVLIEEGRIARIADRIETGTAPVFDAGGRYLSPGLMDMHVHVWDKQELGLYLSNGVTSIRNLWGRRHHLRLADQVRSERIASPDFYTSSPKLTGREYFGDDNTQLKSPEDARRRIAAYREMGYDLIKTYYGLDRDIFEAVLEACRENEMEIAAHPSQKVPYGFHFQSPIVSIEHAEDIVQQPLKFQLDSLELEEVVGDFATAGGAALCPTLTVYYNIHEMLQDEGILQSERMVYMNPMIRKTDSRAQFDRWSLAKSENPEVSGQILEQHKFHLYIVRRLHEEGVPIVCGTDAGIGVTRPGFSIHRELAFYVEAGLNPYEALATATVNPSRMHGFLGDKGTIEEEKVANLLLLEGNPLDDLGVLERPSAVFVHGRRIERAMLDTFEERARSRGNLATTGLRYLEYLLLE